MFKSPIAVSSNPNLNAAALAALVTLLVGAAPNAAAQSSIPNAMQGFAENRDQPIRIEADALEIRDKTKQAAFSGNVKVIQGDTTMTSKALDVLYASDPPASPTKTDVTRAAKPSQSAPPGTGGNSAIKRLEARGNVVVSQKDKVVTGQRAVYDTSTNLISMLGGVVLTRCQDVLRGDRLLVDMSTGISRIEADNGRVSASINRSPDARCEQPSPSPAAAPKPRK
jgi:lipopolysaccharide export system protein LptA